MMKHVKTYQVFGMGVALVTIVLGTYFIFHSVIIFFLSLLKKSEQISLKKLNNFTLSQLSFRIREYTQMLSMVAMLFALALGALTVGLGFRNEISEMTENAAGYDLVMNNPRAEDQQKSKNYHQHFLLLILKKKMRERFTIMQVNLWLNH